MGSGVAGEDERGTEGCLSDFFFLVGFAVTDLVCVGEALFFVGRVSAGGDSMGLLLFLGAFCADVALDVAVLFVTILSDSTGSVITGGDEATSNC